MYGAGVVGGGGVAAGATGKVKISCRCLRPRDRAYLFAIGS